MRFGKAIGIVLLFMAIPLGHIYAQETTQNKNVLVVSTSPSTRLYFYLSKNPKWHFSAHENWIEYDNTTYQIEHSTEIYGRFEYQDEDEMAGVSSPEVIKYPQIIYDENKVTVSTDETTANVQIINIKGAAIINRIVAPNSVKDFDLSAISAGVYIIKVNNQAIKFIKK
ncbi:MAG: T9SS type A sorting domain-containing protein [Muribaculaceae bacterium]|nr:T9SS type A sorting domain-containing protein [Muribaculaceae bacterium]